MAYTTRGDGSTVLTYVHIMGNLKFNNESTIDCCMDVTDEARKINDADGAAIMRSVSNCASSAEFQSLDKSQRDCCIKDLKQEGLSIRQISRLTGVSFRIVRNQ